MLKSKMKSVYIYTGQIIWVDRSTTISQPRALVMCNYSSRMCHIIVFVAGWIAPYQGETVCG